MMEHLIAVTDRNLCQRDFFVQIERICRQKPDRIILREKDLPDDIYIKYVQKCKILCSAYGIPLSVNGRIEIAKSLSVPDIHLSYQALIGRPEVISEFSHTGVSIHSVEEAAQAARLGVSYIIAGHIFATDCKKDLPPRGLPFLRNVCRTVLNISAQTGQSPMPVYAIGGISFYNLSQVIASGAAGGCMMSAAMQL